MIYRVFTILDVKAEAFLRPFVAQTLGVAVRALTEAAQDPRHEFSKYPNDYVLWETGTFDDHTGEVMACRPLNHGLVRQLVRYYSFVSSDETAEAADAVSNETPVLPSSTG